MNERQFQRYMRESGKHEIRRDRVVRMNPLAAHRKLEQLLSEKWLWGVLPHNCVNFVRALRWLTIPCVAVVTVVIIWAAFFALEEAVDWSPGNDWVFSFAEIGFVVGAGVGVWIVLRARRRDRSPASTRT